MGSMVVYTSEKVQLYDAKCGLKANRFCFPQLDVCTPKRSGHAGPIKKTIRVRENCPMAVKTRAD